ncbi:hypothetical protein CSC62_14030 [Pseudoxanthomonas jiangsuensis]|uniref:hypothetical protein n=1 Tax=Pseudoxanthomonas jiangsuensis TaxID=619688 RepID=UPI001390FC3E|nr:hypothetical protein [Pseudoxanthomonas jiangsuensis]KAF1692749.1 hypothetical protein CSC62_14030 [Pseudoxanthomonas jiangsuensis]
MNSLLVDPFYQVALIALLAIALVLVGVAIGGLLILWWRHVGLVGRVTRLETRSESALTREELHALQERMSAVETEARATNRLVQTMHEFLLEKD